MTTIESRPYTAHYENSLPEEDQHLFLPSGYPVTQRGGVSSRPSEHHSLGVDSWDRTEWVAHAECRTENQDLLFVQSKEQQYVVARCRNCPVRQQCRADALDNHVDYGIWGGTTERERRSLLRRFPSIPSWGKLLNPATQEKTIKLNVGDPSGALEALAELDANLERRFKRFRTMQIRHFKSVLADIAVRVEKAGDEDDDTEIETMETLEALRKMGLSNLLRD